MFAQRLRHVVSIRQRATDQNGYGENAGDWTDLLTDIRATVTPISGRERIKNAANLSEFDALVKLRYRDGIEPQMRVLFRGKLYEIVSVVNVTERDRCIELLCKYAELDDSTPANAIEDEGGTAIEDEGGTIIEDEGA